MKEPFIFLCPEVTREDALSLIGWLRDDEVRKYLSDPHDVSRGIEQALENVSLPVLTHLFSRDGRFYMAYTKENMPVGFVRLLVKGNETEIVIVIGERKNWGKGLGASTIRESLKAAFFELRSKRVKALIHRENRRSIRAFISAGFIPDNGSAAVKSFTLTMDDYLSSINKRAAVPDEIYITEIDKDRLKKLITNELWNGGEAGSVRDLVRELDRANIVGQKQIPRDVVTMNSRALLSLNEDEIEVSLVYPGEADSEKQKLSVFSPIGTAILGYGEGDRIEWEVPSGLSRIHIRKILYQPEAAGDYHL
jgi:regulator of nucleoside diphosphate kinase